MEYLNDSTISLEDALMDSEIPHSLKGSIEKFIKSDIDSSRRRNKLARESGIEVCDLSKHLAQNLEYYDLAHEKYYELNFNDI